ncbi:MAG: hypothetical protein AAGA44_03630 [Pseudomonadota bacterium]
MSKESLRKKQLQRNLREIRRANYGIQACSEVLVRDDENSGCIPAVRGVFIRLRAMEIGGLHCAIHTLASLVEETLDDLDNQYEFGYHEEYLPEVRRECDIDDRVKSGEITPEQGIAEHEKNTGFPGPLQ